MQLGRVKAETRDDDNPLLEILLLAQWFKESMEIEPWVSAGVATAA